MWKIFVILMVTLMAILPANHVSARTHTGDFTPSLNRHHIPPRVTIFDIIKNLVRRNGIRLSLTLSETELFVVTVDDGYIVITGYLSEGEHSSVVAYKGDENGLVTILVVEGGSAYYRVVEDSLEEIFLDTIELIVNKCLGINECQGEQ